MELSSSAQVIPQLVSVAVSAPLRGLFTYSVPEPWAGRLGPGHLVEVPFGRSIRRGVVVGPGQSADTQVKLKPIAALVDPQPVFAPGLLRTILWAADYYLAPPGEMAFLALPPALRKLGSLPEPRSLLVVSARPDSLDEDARATLARRSRVQSELLRSLQATGPREVAELEQEGSQGVRAALRALQKKGLVDLERQFKPRRPESPTLPGGGEILTLTEDQDQALVPIRKTMNEGRYETFLLHGVTGSGKTEVYLRAIGQALQLGKGAVLLVPEISLTPQLVSRVTARFGDQVAVLHSGLSDGERLDEWVRLRRGEALVAVGARSALFAPIRSLGIVVVDEEHDSSYKQSSTRNSYNGRDLALVRAREEGAVVILGSATPSVEAYYHAQSGRSRLLKLRTRVLERPMPQVEVVDLKSTLLDPIERIHCISPLLAERLAETLDRGEQAILFLNRRGYSAFAICKSCGQSIQCNHCSVALVYHLHEHQLCCHYCGHSTAVPTQCGQCPSGKVKLVGMGTEKCEEELLRRFPGARVIRMDSDTTARRNALPEMLRRFSRKEADILLGTQMVTKGHDVPSVTLVGVLLADINLHLPDFRAAERTFQLLVQVSGRAGRGERPGRVVIQTFMPTHESIVLARELKFEEFFRRESQRRAGLGYPPNKRLCLIRTVHPDQTVAAQMAQEIASAIRSQKNPQVSLLGPVVSPLAKIRNMHRFQMLLKSSTVKDLHQLVQGIQAQVKPPRNGKVLFDVDPLDML